MKSLVPPNARIVTFPNGTSSIEDGSAMHSEIGPETEARLVYLEPSRFAERLSRPASDPLVLWDVGMGIAGNSLAAIDLARRLPKSRPLVIESFEHRLDGLKLALDFPERFPWILPHWDAVRALLTQGLWSGPGIAWRLHAGDFLQGPWPHEPAEVVFYDFYAPTTCPELWGYQVFADLKTRLREDGVLCTYSCSTAVRSALALAGFRVGRGAGTERKRETTIAMAEEGALSDPLGRDWLEKLARSHRPWPADWPAARHGEAWRILEASL